MPAYTFKLVAFCTVLTSESANVSDYSPHIILPLVITAFVTSQLP